jgi:hypothetical protein
MYICKYTVYIYTLQIYYKMLQIYVLPITSPTESESALCRADSPRRFARLDQPQDTSQDFGRELDQQPTTRQNLLPSPMNQRMETKTGKLSKLYGETRRDRENRW